MDLAFIVKIPPDTLLVTRLHFPNIIYVFQDLLHYRDNEKTSLDLQEALDCMLVVLKCVNDSMHQIAITGFRVSKPESKRFTTLNDHFSGYH